jgi:two-component system phosphate regulon sensor histidine kinase PhoR
MRSTAGAMSEFAVRSTLAIALAALAATAAGLVFGAAWGWAVFSLVLLALLVHHLIELSKLRDWAAQGRAASVPEGRGVWEEVFSSLYRKQRADIRQRRELARTLARSRQAGRALPYGVAILDAGYRIIWCNDSSEAHFGIHSDRDAGHPVTNLVRQPEFVHYVSAGDFSRPLQLRGAGEDALVLSVQFVPYLDSNRLLLSRDVTQATRLEHMRRDFVANVSHELRTPLTVLIGFLETVRELRLDPQRSRDYLNLMAEQGKRMQHIIDDLLMLSTLESAPKPPADERVNLAMLLARIRAEAEGLSGGRHEIEVDGDIAFDLLGAEHELASAFCNLVSNAIRYTPLRGTIRIRWRASSEGASFSVEDTGIGIEKEHIPRLTERFYRVDRGRSRESGGTGLGLAIVKHALARHEAGLEIESEAGKGSRFTARFPAGRIISSEARAERSPTI